VVDAPESDAQLEDAVAAWRGWCRALEETGAAVLGQALTTDEIDYAEGLRYLGRAAHFVLFGRTENRDSGHPYFWPYLGPHVKIGGDNPQGLYLSAPINPTDTFVIRGTRGSARWFSAVVMRGPGARAAGEPPIGAELYLPDLRSSPTAPSSSSWRPIRSRATGSRAIRGPTTCWSGSSSRPPTTWTAWT